MARHVPMRTCIATGVKKPKNEMVRLVRADQTTEQAADAVRVLVDTSGRVRGRGANLDSNLSALETAFRKGAIERALKLDCRLNDTEKNSLREAMSRLLEEREFRQGNRNVVLKISSEEFKTKLGQLQT